MLFSSLRAAIGIVDRGSDENRTIASIMTFLNQNLKEVEKPTETREQKRQEAEKQGNFYERRPEMM